MNEMEQKLIIMTTVIQQSTAFYLITSFPPRHSAVSLVVNCSRKYGSKRLITFPSLSRPITALDLFKIS